MSDNERRFKNWIKAQKKGTRFTLRALTSRLNIDVCSLGHYVKYVPGIEKGEILPGNIREYIVTGEAS